MNDSDEFQAAVRAFADAHVRGDIAVFASYMTPQAVISLHREQVAARRPRSFRIIDEGIDGETGNSVLEFSGRGAYRMALVWQCIDGHWKVTGAIIPTDSVRVPWWRRLLRRGAVGDEPGTERRDLA